MHTAIASYGKSPRSSGSACDGSMRSFRLGGDEFAVLLSGAWLTDAGAIAEQLRDAVERAELGGGRSVSISVGVAELGHDDSVADWLAAGDAALYDAKHAGRNRVALRMVRTVTRQTRVS